MICQNCGAELPPRSKSNRKWCNACYQKVHTEQNRRSKCRRRGTPEYKQAQSERNKTVRLNRYLGVKDCNHRKVMVMDDKCAAPYFISLHEYELYKQEYRRMPGVTVTILV